MSFIYHMVPKIMIGSRLIPLNNMRTTNADLYLKEASKYQGREKLLERRIPKADCLWNDVLHFSAVNPELIFSRLEKLGFGPFAEIKWYEVPLDRIKGLPNFIYRAPQHPRQNFILHDSDVQLLDIDNYSEPKELTDQAEAYFLHCKTENKTPLLFQFTPHILVRGELETAGLNIASR